MQKSAENHEKELRRIKERTQQNRDKLTQASKIIGEVKDKKEEDRIKEIIDKRMKIQQKQNELRQRQQELAE